MSIFGGVCADCARADQYGCRSRRCEFGDGSTSICDLRPVCLCLLRCVLVCIGLASNCATISRCARAEFLRTGPVKGRHIGIQSETHVFLGFNAQRFGFVLRRKRFDGCWIVPVHSRSELSSWLKSGQYHVWGAVVFAAPVSSLGARRSPATPLVPFVGFEGLRSVETWLILPVVICLSQRLSHACLSISFYMAKLRMAHYNSYSLFDGQITTWITVVILELIHAKRPDLRRAVFIR